MVQVVEQYVSEHGAIEIAARPLAAARMIKPAERAAQLVAIDAGWEDATTLQIALRIAEGFHIHAHETKGDFVPTRLQVDRDATVDYPPGEMNQFPFADELIAIYAGQVIVRVRFEEAPQPDRPIRIALTYQACDDTSCLPPVTKQFELQQK
jgi:hypothetical protein